jgi:hypothetical protein
MAVQSFADQTGTIPAPTAAARERPTHDASVGIADGGNGGTLVVVGANADQGKGVCNAGHDD